MVSIFFQALKDHMAVMEEMKRNQSLRSQTRKGRIELGCWRWRPIKWGIRLRIKAGQEVILELLFYWRMVRTPKLRRLWMLSEKFWPWRACFLQGTMIIMNCWGDQHYQFHIDNIILRTCLKNIFLLRHLTKLLLAGFWKPESLTLGRQNICGRTCFNGGEILGLILLWR